MKSNSGNDGTYTLNLSFELGTDPDINAVNVNNRVQTATSQLPQEVQVQGVTVQKRSSSLLQFLAMYSDAGKYDPLFISNYLPRSACWTSCPARPASGRRQSSAG